MSKYMKNLKLFFTALCLLFIFQLISVNGQSKQISITGVIKKIVIDDQPARYEYLLSTGRENFRLQNAAPSIENFINRRVSLSGSLESDRFFVAGEIRALDAGKTPSIVTPPTFGSRKVLVLLIKFPDTPPLNLTPEIARAKIFTGDLSPNKFVKEASLNRYQLTGLTRPDGDVSNWLTMPSTPTGCDIYGQWTQEARMLARQNGFEPNNYNSIIYVFPHTCSFNPSATVGTMGGTETAEGIWVNEGSVFNERVMIHEMGHNLGLMHSGALSCPGNDIPGGCTRVEYGDVFDAMGSGINFFFNNYSRLALGWLTGRSAKVTESGKFLIVSPSQTSKGIQILEIPLNHPDGNPTGWSYFLEYRRPFSFDNRLTEPGYDSLYNGVGIRRAPSQFVTGMGTDLMDATPNTPTHVDATLTAGYTFLDNYHGIFIITNSTNPQFGARVSVYLLNQ